VSVPETIVDCDVHPSLSNGLRDLTPYFATAWRERIGLRETEVEGTGRAGSSPQLMLPTNTFYRNVGGVLRADARPPGGGLPGSDPGYVVEHLLDAHDIHRALLTGAVMLGGFPDADVQAAIATAYNDWQQERWLEYDERFRGALVVGPRNPERAVDEIDRMARRPQIAAVLLPLFNIAMGERHYYPIYDAAQRHGLPVVVHPGGTEGIFAYGPNLPYTPSYYLEWRMLLSQVHQANVTSLICNGVFDDFPELRIVVIEGGFMWAAELMFKFDREWLGLRDEVPWLKRPPSDYLREHISFTTQPMPEPHRREHLAPILEMIYAEETLLYSSDYPHWDFDDPHRALTGVPAHLHRAIFSENAQRVFGDRLR
jgi:uncharacterized protein